MGIFQAVLALILVSCGSGTGSSSSGDAIHSDSQTQPSENPIAYAVNFASDLPTCDQNRRTQLAYLISEKRFQYCSGSDWIDLNVGIEDSVSRLFTIEDEAVGFNCPAGGKAILSGFDTNSNAYLDPNEISATDYVCNGTPGNDGSSGSQGEKGTKGEKGEKGDRGLDASTETTTSVDTTPVTLKIDYMIGTNADPFAFASSSVTLSSTDFSSALSKGLRCNLTSLAEHLFKCDYSTTRPNCFGYICGQGCSGTKCTPVSIDRNGEHWNTY